jgi:ureidoglycolate hydrolase
MTGVIILDKVIKIITRESFSPYGYVIEHDAGNKENFQVILSESGQVGWRIAVSKVVDKSLKKIARHPTTMESFEPVSGVTMIVVAPPADPENYEVFLLDKPVCVYKNTWHATICLSDYSIVKICENNTVSSEFHEFGREIGIRVVEN